MDLNILQENPRPIVFIVRPSVQDRAVLGLMWTQVGQRLNSDMAATAALTMFLELMDDDGLFVTAK